MNIENADYSEQRSIPRVQIPRVITVVGTGAFGSWVAFFAALAGVERLILINPGSADALDRHNVQGREIACGPFPDSDIGRLKVDALSDLIHRHRPNIQIIKHVIFWDASHAGLLEGVVFAGISSDLYQDQIWTAAEQKGLRCIGGSYNGALCGVATSRDDMPKVNSSLAAWVGSAAMSGLLAAHSALVDQFSFFGDVTKQLSQSGSALHENIRVGGNI
jgi:hypothetical protein